MAPLTVGEAVRKSAGYLRSKGVEDSPKLDAELLLCEVLRTDRIHLYMDWQKPLMELEISAYRELLRRRGQDREPVARILGWKEFHGRRFELSPATFVPRPETEGLTERALELLRTEPLYTSQHATVLEVGTGTGCIVVTLAAEEGQHRYLATDVSERALEVARANARRHHVDRRIEFRHGPGLAGWKGQLGMVVSNPPYIESATIPALQPEVKDHDPMPALDGGADGLDAVRQIAGDVDQCLAPGGWILLELGEGQDKAACELFRESSRYELVRTEKDLAGIPRYLMAKRVRPDR